ncbi:MAG: twin-arginine translocase subunit TatC [Candidatus Omnitrophica bacterium]|nr:twin-arginine translocase subunit TatC [Candidatus Omnitrophota bacterium]
MTKNLNDFSFWDHLEELRSRLIKMIVVFCLFSCLVYAFFVDRILFCVTKPVGKLFFTSPPAAFMARFSLAMWGGFFLTIPFILYQIWQFVALGLKTHEQKYVLLFGLSSLGLFICGGVFAFWVMIPVTVRFLLSFQSAYLLPLLTVNDYLSFVGTFILACGLAFEVPLAVLFLTKIGLVTPQFLAEKRRHAIIGILIISAVITPTTDIVTQAVMSVPLFILYEMSIFASKFVHPREM